MLLQQTIDFHSLYTEGKFWVSAAGVIITIYKVYVVLKKALAEDIPAIQSSVVDMQAGLKEQTKALESAQEKHTQIIRECFDKQTDELRDLKTDLKLYTTTVLAAPVRAKAARAARRKNKK